MITLNSIELINGLQWVNEFTQNKVSMTTHRTLAGTTVVYHGQRKNGFPIDLESKSDTGWVTRSIAKQLQSLSEQSGLVMDLVIRDEAFKVMFRHNESNAFEASPIMPFATPKNDDYYLIKLKLITIGQLD